jgi:ubiquinone/menaquinone biosynthesis C-methylase UbiE
VQESYPEHPAFTGIAPYYDALMRGVPYRQWARYLDRLLSHRKVKPKRILDLACGTGNVTELLVARGAEVVGVDLSAPMIEMARRKALQKRLSIAYFVQDAGEMDLPGPPFDLCVSFFDSLNYIADPAHLEKAIQRVSAHLAPGGLFIFDINSEFALINSFFDQENTHSNDRLRYAWRSEYDASTRLCYVHMRFFLRESNGVDREFRETHVQFAYREDELREMLLRAGFEGIETFHAYTFRPVSPTTDRIFFVAQRSG